MKQYEPTRPIKNMPKSINAEKKFKKIGQKSFKKNKNQKKKCHENL